MGSGQSKEYFDISFFFNTHEAKKNRQGKDLLARNQVNMSDWSKMLPYCFRELTLWKANYYLNSFKIKYHDGKK